MDDRRENLSHPLTNEKPLKGQIYNKARSNQKNDYSGLLYNKTMTPTDLDGLIEFMNKGYVFIEVKYKDNILPVGQRIAIERLVVDTAANNKESIALVVEHYIDDPLIDVPVADCYVRMFYYSRDKKWVKPKSKITSKEYIFRFLDHLNAKKG